jgi:RND family efflux transporter MFP subunit
MKRSTSTPVIVRIVLCLLILGAGFVGFIALKMMKKPPVQAQVTEQALPVQVMTVQPEEVTVVISGFGEIRSRTLLPLSAEVSGRITTVHPQLEAGGVINRGEVLLTINDKDFKVEYEAAKDRFASLQRDLTLAKKEFERQRRLYTNNKVGSESGVEKAEQAVNSLTAQISQVRQLREIARLRLERCILKSPFSGRITQVKVEEGEYVTPGKELLQIVDDRDLEIEVPLDSREAVNWLQFEPAEQSAWFGLPQKKACQIIWTEQGNVQASGHLDRVVRFDAKTRTLVVAVKLEAQQGAAVPLVQGMFCRVDIPGHSLNNVFVLPRQAVSFENTVYVVVDGRLHTRKVEVARIEGSRALISKGIEAGELVITTRLENPLEKMLVRIDPAGEPQK